MRKLKKKKKIGRKGTVKFGFIEGIF